MAEKVTQQALDLFASIESLNRSNGHSFAAGSLDVNSQIRSALSSAIKRCPYSISYVSARMSELLGQEISIDQLYSYTAESKKKHRFPLEYLPAFVEATGDRSILHLLSDKCSGSFIESKDTLRLELGRITEEEKNLRQRKRMIELHLGDR